MKLTLENFILFLRGKYAYGEKLNAQTKLRDENSEFTFDGIDAVYLLEGLEKEFDVTFENFDFHEYFLDESELNTMNWKAIFKQEKRREIKAELTIQKLFDYMSKSTKNTT